jgi:hypothetical protein
MRLRRFIPFALCMAALGSGAALAHHSFAVFFDAQKSVSITGVVTEFQFVNPHGVIRLDAKNKDGATEEWKIETNSPSILRRRGWSADSLKIGETVTIEGWPARDNSRYARLRKATRESGEPVGKPFDSDGE